MSVASVGVAGLGEIARQRVRAHQLEPIMRRSAAEVVAGLVAMQAQDYRGGLWSVGSRSELSEAAVEQALADREIVRTWPMRGTIHLLAAADASWLPALLGPRASQAAAGRRRGLGLDDESVARTRAVWEDVLAGGKCLGRPELFAAMDAAGVDSGNQRGPHLLRYFAEQGVICFGVQQGRQPTYALLAEWVPQSRALDREAALAELALRYFTGHGPVTVEDFAGWGFLTMGDARAGLAAVADQLQQVEVGGATYWFADGQILDGRAQAPAPWAAESEPPAGVQLLAGFDEYVLGYKNRSAFATPSILDAVVPGGNGVFKATVLNDGQIVGLWSVKRLTRRQVISFDWFAGRTVPERPQLELAVQRYADFCQVATEF